MDVYEGVIDHEDDSAAWDAYSEWCADEGLGEDEAEDSEAFNRWLEDN